jgi:hypothetical protein
MEKLRVSPGQVEKGFFTRAIYRSPKTRVQNRRDCKYISWLGFARAAYRVMLCGDSHLLGPGQIQMTRIQVDHKRRHSRLPAISLLKRLFSPPLAG